MASFSTVFVVVGGIRAQFPTDMLRYDRCWPASAADANLISWSLFADGFDRGIVETAGSPKELRIRLLSADPGSPTVARWESFGWKVEEE